MRKLSKLTLALLRVLFLPQGPLSGYIAAAGKASLKDVAKWALLAAMVFLLSAEGSAVFAAWLVTTVVFVTYQYLYVFSYPIQRPVLYEETSLIGILLVALNHVTVAALCSIGWIGVVLHTYCGYYLLQIVGRLAIARETKKMISEVCRDYPSESMEKRMAMLNVLLENRIEEVHSF